VIVASQFEKKGGAGVLLECLALDKTKNVVFK
jgi:hypothetical protein